MKCKKCLLHSKVMGVVINRNGLCNYCNGTAQFGVLSNPEKLKQFSNKEELFKEFLNSMNVESGTGEYDVILGLSGGKDSAYLLFYLLKHFHLRILTVTIDNGFESDTAIENIEKIKGITKINHIYIDSFKEIFKKGYRYLLTKKPETDSVKEICGFCTLLWHHLLISEAVKRNAPFVLIGYSPDQIENYFYEITKDEISAKGSIFNYVPESSFSPDEKKKIIDLFGKSGLFPKILLPFHVFPDYSEKEVRETIAREGFIPKRKSLSEQTNCRINWLMMYKDLNLLGYNPYLESFSYLIRNGKMKKSLWQLKFKIGNILIKSGLFPGRIIKDTLKRLG
ncbi:MAG: hypothetical protein PHV06_03130, partial [bacterium]|nr:hypothetical protein [bacterium]